MGDAHSSALEEYWKPGERCGVFKEAPGTPAEATSSQPEPHSALTTQGLDFCKRLKHYSSYLRLDFQKRYAPFISVLNGYGVLKKRIFYLILKMCSATVVQN